MKKIITKTLLALSIVLCVMKSNAQLKVYSGGKVEVGSTSATPGEALEIKATDATQRIWNSNDAGGGFIGNTYSSLQLGIFNPSGSTFGVVAAGAKKSFFGIDNNGKVGSLTNSYGTPTFRNYLDDGSGNINVTGGSNSFQINRVKF